MTVRKVIPDESPKRQAILQAALELFAERGFHGTTVPEVAERAGVGAGTLYRYFESKEALVNALYQHWKTEFGGGLLASLPFGSPVRQIFHELWQLMGKFARQHPTVMTFLELHSHRDYLDEQSRALETSILEPVRAFVREAQQQQALKAGSPEVLMAVVYGAFTGILRATSEGYLTMSQSVLDEAERCVWEAIRA